MPKASESWTTTSRPMESPVAAGRGGHHSEANGSRKKDNYNGVRWHKRGVSKGKGTSGHARRDGIQGVVDAGTGTVVKRGARGARSET